MTSSAYKILVTDLDGTLLDDNSHIPDANRRAVELAAERGVMTVISSGRSYMSVKYFEEQLGLVKEGGYGICFNGGIVYETQSRRKLMEKRLNRGTAMYILSELKAFPVDVMIYLDTELLAEKETGGIFAYRDRSRLPLTLVEDFGDIREDFSKILIKGENELLNEVATYMKPLMTDRFNMFFSSSSLLEFCCPDVDKGRGLMYLLEHLGIAPEACIAAGDQANDIPMIEAAGLGVAVRNARPEVLRSAKYITDATNNDGALLEIVKKFIL